MQEDRQVARYRAVEIRGGQAKVIVPADVDDGGEEDGGLLLDSPTYVPSAGLPH